MGQDAEGVWQRTLMTFLHTHGMSYAYWAWNADSGDTGGILQDNWRTVNQSKVCWLLGTSLHKTCASLQCQHKIISGRSPPRLPRLHELEYRERITLSRAS